jgi:hypothetical protein
MKFHSTMFAILLGLAAIGVPAIASAHPKRAYHRAAVSQWFHSVPYARRQRFLGNHPYLASHRWMLHQTYGAHSARWYRKHPGALNSAYQGVNNQEPDGDEYGASNYSYAQPGWRHHEPDRDDYRAACGGDGDADDCAPAAYRYGVPSYGYGSTYYGNSYRRNGMSSTLPMLQQFIP